MSRWCPWQHKYRFFKINPKLIIKEAEGYKNLANKMYSCTAAKRSHRISSNVVKIQKRLYNLGTISKRIILDQDLFNIVPD